MKGKHRKTHRKQLPSEARQLLAEAIEYMGPFIESIEEARAAGIPCDKAEEFAGACAAGIQKRAKLFFPELALPEETETS